MPNAAGDITARGIPVIAYLLTIGNDKNILIDSGFPESYVENSIEFNESNLTIEIHETNFYR